MAAEARAVPLLARLGAARRERLGLSECVRRLAPGQELFAPDEPRDRVWFAAEGWLLTRAHSHNGCEATAELVGPGEPVGASAVPGLARYPCGAAALGHAVALGVPARAFDRWLAADAAAAVEVAAFLGRRLLQTARLKAINAEPAAWRLPLTLAWLSERFGRVMPVDRALLSDLTGLRVETLSRAMTRLRRRGLARFSSGRLELLAPLERLRP